MAGTKNAILGSNPLPWNIMPGRSPGSLGINDAGDPNAQMCIAADTPGPVGTGGDLSAAIYTIEPMTCEMQVPVVAVDLDKMRRLLYTVALAEATNQAASRRFASTEVRIESDASIGAAARARADALMDQLRQAMETGPTTVADFITTLETRKKAAENALSEKFADASKARSRWTTTLGGLVKACSAVKFVSAVTVKTLSIFTGPAGTAIDWSMSAAQAGVKQGLSGMPSQTVAGVVAEETGKNMAQELGESLNELVADGLMTQTEKNKLAGLIGNYKGDAKKLQEQLNKLEQQIAKALKAGKGANRIAGLTRRSAKALADLKSLPGKYTVRLVQSGRQIGLAKKAAGKTLSFVFLAGEVKDAWNEAAAEFRASD